MCEQQLLRPQDWNFDSVSSLTLAHQKSSLVNTYSYGSLRSSLHSPWMSLTWTSAVGSSWRSLRLLTSTWLSRAASLVRFLVSTALSGWIQPFYSVETLGCFIAAWPLRGPKITKIMLNTQLHCKLRVDLLESTPENTSNAVSCIYLSKCGIMHLSI